MIQRAQLKRSVNRDNGDFNQLSRYNYMQWWRDLAYIAAAEVAQCTGSAEYQLDPYPGSTTCYQYDLG